MHDIPLRFFIEIYTPYPSVQNNHPYQNYYLFIIYVDSLNLLIFIVGYACLQSQVKLPIVSAMKLLGDNPERSFLGKFELGAKTGVFSSSELLHLRHMSHRRNIRTSKSEVSRCIGNRRIYYAALMLSLSFGTKEH